MRAKLDWGTKSEENTKGNTYTCWGICLPACWSKGNLSEIDNTLSISIFYQIPLKCLKYADTNAED
ncbi:hypothetical protein PBN151_0355 [Paenibacillus sp. NAIST15-1]|nr:hypothetical protein PBN151_0355 [Paenibacillus sp. NAIST15-1]